MRVGEFREVDAPDDGALLVQTNVELRTTPLRHGRQRVRPHRRLGAAAQVRDARTAAAADHRAVTSAAVGS